MKKILIMISAVSSFTIADVSGMELKNADSSNTKSVNTIIVQKNIDPLEEDREQLRNIAMAIHKSTQGSIKDLDIYLKKSLIESIETWTEGYSRAEKAAIRIVRTDDLDMNTALCELGFTLVDKSEWSLENAIKELDAKFTFVNKIERDENADESECKSEYILINKPEE